MSQNSSLMKGLVFRSKLDEWGGGIDEISKTVPTKTDVYNVPDRQGSGRREVIYNGTSSYTSLILAADIYTVIIRFYTPTVINGTSGAVGWFCLNNTSAYSAFGGSWSGDLTNSVVMLGTTTNGSYLSSTTETISVGWHTLVFNWETDKYQIYIDGVSKTTTKKGTPAVITSSAIKLGTYGGGDSFYNGSISMFRLFNYALTPTQITNYSKPEYPIEWVDRGVGITLDNQSAIGSRTWSGLQANAQYTLSYHVNVTSGSVRFGGNWDWVTTAKTTTGYYDQPIFTFSSSVSTDNQLYLTLTGDATVDNIYLFKKGCVLDLNSEGLGKSDATTRDLAHWWDATNNTTADIVGASVVIPPASNLGACSFNGTTSNIAFTGMNGLTGDITMSIWINVNTATTAPPFSNYYTYILYSNANNNIGFTRRASGNVNEYALSATNTIYPNYWYNVTVTSTSAGVSSIYINGVLSGSANQLAGTPISRTDLNIGNRPGGGYPFGGLVYKANIWSRILDLDQIKLINDTNF